MDGGTWEVGIGAQPTISISGYEVADAAWASAGKPVKLRLNFLNKGGVRTSTSVIKWSSPTAGVKFDPATSRLPGLAPGESALAVVTVTVAGAPAGSVRIDGGEGGIDVPVYPVADPAAGFTILDESDRDGHASPGERFVLALPDGRAELITNDACVDTSVRIVEEGARYSQAMIRANC